LFGISGFELFLIMVFVLVIFGPEKLPQIGRTVGKAIGTFKKVQQDMEHVIRAEMYASNKKPATASKSGSDDAEEGAEVTGESADKASEIWTMTTETDEADDEEDEE